MLDFSSARILTGVAVNAANAVATVAVSFRNVRRPLFPSFMLSVSHQKIRLPRQRVVSPHRTFAIQSLIVQQLYTLFPRISFQIVSKFSSECISYKVLATFLLVLSQTAGQFTYPPKSNDCKSNKLKNSSHSHALVARTRGSYLLGGSSYSGLSTYERTETE